MAAVIDSPYLTSVLGRLKRSLRLAGMRPLPRLPARAPIDLRGKIVLLTGASTGIGAAGAEQLAAQGATLILVARRESLLAEVAARITAAGGKATAIATDLSRLEAVDDLVRTVGRVDILINNAGRSIRRPLMESLDRWHDVERTIAINYYTPLRLIRGFVPGMIERGDGHVINICSWRVMPESSPLFGVYNASKAALSAVSRVIETELAETGVHSTTIYFPLVATPMIAPTRAYDGLPALTAEEAATWMVTAARTRPVRIAPRKTLTLRALDILSPARLNAVMKRSTPAAEALRSMTVSTTGAGHRPENLPLGALIITAAFFCVAMVTVLAKISGQYTSTGVILLFQNLMCLALMLPIVARDGWASLRTERLGLHILRAAMGTGCWYSVFLAIKLIPLTNAILLTYSAPLWMPLVAWIATRQRIAPATWMGAAIGFAGVILVLQPQGYSYNLGDAAALAGAIFLAIAMMSVRWLGATEPLNRILFYFFLISCLLSAPIALLDWQPVPAAASPWLIAIGFAQLASQYLIAAAYRHAPAEKIGPFIYSVIVFTALIDWIVWHQAPGLLTFLGMALVIGGGLVAVRARARPAPPPP